ncbi:MAG TPA: potassium channel family protein [Gaiellaceae bacterium]|nr:potassium channel family protein [Gaiellaceae bacterium]
MSAQPADSFPRERWIRRRAERAVAQRHVLPFLILAIAVISVSTGAVARLIDRRDFHSLGDGIWWSIVTLGTVGYGDIVPHTAWGRVLGSIVIVCGVTFIAFLTATVTSLFVAVDQQEALAKIRGANKASDEDTRTALRGIDERLAAIEAKLDGPTGSQAQ